MPRLYFRAAVLLVPVLFVLALVTYRVLPASVYAVTGELKAFGFGACPLPCYAGITAGETPILNVETLIAREMAPIGSISRLDLALTALSAETPVRPTVLLTFSRRSRGEHRIIDVNMMGSGDVVGTINISGVIPVWLLLQELGMPHCARLERPESAVPTLRLAWMLPDHVVQAGVPMFRGRWGMRSSAISLNIASLAHAASLTIDSEAPVDGTSRCEAGTYLGFAPAARYQQAVQP